MGRLADGGSELLPLLRRGGRERLRLGRAREAVCGGAADRGALVGGGGRGRCGGGLRGLLAGGAGDGDRPDPLAGGVLPRLARRGRFLDQRGGLLRGLFEGAPGGGVL